MQLICTKLQILQVILELAFHTALQYDAFTYPYLYYIDGDISTQWFVAIFALCSEVGM